MASSLLKLTTILSLVIPIVLALTQAQVTPWTETEDEDEYVLDTPAANFISRSRFLRSVVKKGAHCSTDPYHNICNGVLANNGTSLLQCCKGHCRNVLGDKNNCGQCGRKCTFGQACCGGKCVVISNNPYNCGKCNRQCAPGQKCEYGTCGYA
ncbi:hypothetical protein Tsubulata_029711 [Turnera subulata]|uniref:Uncharacterized protein n=1 Tax=Turnera subulata TaxID=218843 RepID=A0A9Q0JJ67_9ROSI|nr:hypothetical protein Tsubulata_029711 [Turnera subulata]